MNARTYTLLGIAAAAVGLLIWSRSQSGANAVGVIVEKITSTIRGIRNNNPTNLEDAGIQWDGLVGTDGPYLVFESMAKGLRAADINLRNYWRLHGINTVAGIARRWSSTDRDAYVANLSAWMAVDSQEAIDLEDSSTRAKLLKGMVRQEDGLPAELILESQIDAAVDANG